MPINWTRFAQIVADAERFVLTTHMRPDCDALGSELGMAMALHALGKNVTIVNGDAVPEVLKFIDPGQRVQVLGQDGTAEAIRQADVLMVLDTSAWAQLGPMADVLRDSAAQKVVVDHHVSEDDLGAESFKNSKAESTGRLVVEAADALGVELMAEMATPLFAAIATDTGWFRFSSVDAATYQAAGRLVAAGATPQTIYSVLYEQDTLARLLLRGKILARVERDVEGRLLYSSALRADFDEVGAVPTDTEDVINALLRVVGSEVALLFIELSGGGVKVSMRSRGPIDVRAIAEQFGGGGHRAAAGVTVEGTLSAVREKILDATRLAMR